MKKEIEAFVNAANEQELEAAWNNLSAEEQRVFVRARIVPWPQIFNTRKFPVPFGTVSCWGVPAPNPYFLKKRFPQPKEDAP